MTATLTVDNDFAPSIFRVPGTVPRDAPQEGASMCSCSLFDRPLTTILTLLLLSSSAHADGFRPIDIGVPVNDWLPALISPDGTWDLAIRTGEDPVRVGVYDPASESWIDGPHPLPVSGQSWGASDYDHDGSIDYAYLTADGIRLRDFFADTDTLLWEVTPWTRAIACFYGSAGPMNPTVALIGTRSRDDAIAQKSAQTPSEVIHPVTVYTIFGAEFVTSLYGSFAPPFYLSTFSNPSTTELVLYHLYFWYSGDDNRPPCRQSSSYELYVLAQDWQKAEHWDVWTYYGSCHPDIRVPRGFGCARSGGADPSFYLAVIDSPWGQELKCFTSGNRDAIWTVAYSSGPYSSVVGFDLNERGEDMWILPLQFRRGWERRELATGAIIDTIHGMPTVELRTGPLFVPDQRDLFFIAGSILNVWDTTTAVEDNEADSAPVPRDPDLRAYPNPFNSGVCLAWDQGATVSGLTVFNILGQPVRRFDMDDRQATSLEWDCRNSQGVRAPSGLYFARITGPSTTATIKLVLLR